MARIGALVLTVPLTVLALAACGDDEQKFDPKRATALETTLAPAQIEAGQATTVTCVRLNGKGAPLEGGSFTLQVSPGQGASVSGLQVTSTRAGTHAIACEDAALGLVDETPAELVVTAGPAVRTVIALDPTSVPAGTKAAVTCNAQDQYGNVAAANLRLEVSPATSVTIDGTTGVSATATGNYEVTCFAANVDESARAKATLGVTPGARAGIALRADPEQLAYRLLQPVTITAVGVDAYGNAIAGEVAVDGIDATPAGHHKLVGDALDKIRFDLEGKYIVSAHAKDAPDQTATLPIVVDQTPPELVLTSPERGLVTDVLSEVTVNGTVTDNLGEIGSLRIGDRPIAVPPGGGAFSTKVPLKYALTLIDIHAADPYGNESLATRAVEQSSRFHPLLARNFQQDGIDNAVALVLAQEAFDDGNHTEASRDDLAHLFEFIIENIDFASFVPNPLTSFSCIGGNCTLALTDVTIDDVVVTMTLTNGRIQMKVELVGFSGEITLFFPCDVAIICPVRPVTPLPGTISTNKVVLTTEIMVSVVNGETRTEAQNTQVEIDGLDVTIPDPTGLAQAAINLVVTYIRDPLITAMELIMVSLVEDQVASALGGLFSALTINQEFDLPSPVPDQAPNTIVIETQPAGVDISPERLQLRVNGLAHAKNPARPREHLGSISHEGCAPDTALTFPPVAPIVVGLHDDLINELLFAVWEGGTLSLDLGPEEAAALVGDFGLADATILVDAMLPPVFDSCRRDNTVQLGDLYLEAEATFVGDPIHLGLWIATEAGIGIELAPNEEGALQAKLVLGDLDPMFIEVVINEGAFADDDETVVGLIRDTLIPQLLGTVSDSASFTLPSIDLGALTTAVPAGTVINLDVREVGRDNAYLTIEGALK